MYGALCQNHPDTEIQAYTIIIYQIMVVLAFIIDLFRSSDDWGVIAC